MRFIDILLPPEAAPPLAAVPREVLFGPGEIVTIVPGLLVKNVQSRSAYLGAARRHCQTQERPSRGFEFREAVRELRDNI